LDEALESLTDWLPRGERRDNGRAADADAVLAAAERSALLTATQYTAQGSAEIAGSSTDLVLARLDGELHFFSRDPHDQVKLMPSAGDDKDVHETLVDLVA
jgi:hypothetical protein